MTFERQLVLASSSPRRKTLLQDAGYRFEVIPATIEEPRVYTGDLPPELKAEALAYFKAKQAALAARKDCVVLAADTIVAQGDHIFGKPKDESDARDMLYKLSHNPHLVITGMVLLETLSGRRLIDFDKSRIFMKPMSDKDIDAYIETGRWQDKAGGYAVRENVDKYIERIEGSFTNVVGLPMELVERMLAWATRVHIRRSEAPEAW